MGRMYCVLCGLVVMAMAVGIGGEAKAESIRSGGMFGIGLGGGTGTSGLSMKYWMSSSHALNVRGARFSGLLTNWLGVIMLLPLIALTVIGFMAWMKYPR